MDADALHAVDDALRVGRALEARSITAADEQKDERARDDADAFQNRIINQALRGNNRELFLRLKPYIDLSTEALNKLPDYAGTCRRGVKDLPADVLDRYKVGRVVEEAGFTSTTYGTEPFKGRIQFIIEAKRAKKIDFMSLYPEQKEALIAPGAQFKVLERVTVGDTTYIRMEEM